MSDERVITGTYSDFKIIKTRQVAQVIIEVPLERSKEVIDKFGLPMPNEEIWVAIAQIRTERSTGNARASKAIQQAGILCKDQTFGIFLQQHKNLSDVNPADHTTIENAVRAVTGVKSRAEWRTNDGALIAWERLYKEYSSFA
tara:strand:- start:1297 stop:1725 length:429 start_codon:yes stop_codon:yes gene_type:complete